ncbi:recombination-associated protein RdgC [Aromatoleum toluolicum]|uniref:Recombination-associated protein RdgC n=1 Tax=Aromatoleum toluolicum TaxID=90060 RepID=A0ABX1NGJ7_9RHOO|nr:recombination-associated protein RdgC [Aromatoleum toluolicum]
MIRNALAYHLPSGWPWDADAMSEYLSRRTFQPCCQLDHESSGFVPPRDEANLCHQVGDFLLVCLQTEERLLPAYVVAEHADLKAEEMMQMQGFKPGRKQMKEIKEAVLLELLPQAFTRKRRTLAWIDPASSLLIVDAASANRAEDVLSQLHQALDMLPVEMLRTERTPTTTMADWLASGDAPQGFSIDQECELVSVGEDGASVRYTRHDLHGDDVRDHLAAGKLPASLALTFSDRVSFVLTEKMEVKRVVLLDVPMQGREQADDAIEQFDADFLLAASEVGILMRELIYVHGGLMVKSDADLVAHAESARGAFNRLAALAASDGGSMTISDGEGNVLIGAGNEYDPLYPDAKRIVIEQRKPSISLIQRHLRIGYNRAARLIEQMESDGIVSAMKADGTREVIAA